MNKLVKALFFFLAVGNAALYATSDSELFQKANELYKAGNFEQAYAAYQKIAEKDASVHYNLGNCAYKLSKFGHALLYWRKAEKEWGIFNRTELLNNIKQVKEALKTEVLQTSKEENPVTLFMKYLKTNSFSFMQAIPLFYLQILFLIVWLFLFFYHKYLYKKDHKFIIVIVFLLVSVCGSMLAIKYGMLTKQYGVVVQPRAQLLSGPGSTYHALMVIPEGKEGIIYKESHDFYKIKINGIIGWIKRGEFEKI